MAVLSIPLQQSLTFEIPGQTVRYGVSKLIELAACRGFDPPKLCRHRIIYVHSIEKQHVKMDIQIQRTAKALNQGYSTCVCSRPRVTRFPDQMCGNGAISNAQCFALIWPGMADGPRLQRLRMPLHRESCLV